MKYEPIKERIGSAIGASHGLRKLYYALLGIFLLRAWHVKREIRKIYRTARFKNVLDAGCGPGEYSYYIAKKFSAKVTGVDVIDAEVERCNRFARDQRLRDAKFIVADLSSGNFPTAVRDRFNLIVSVDVMEHIKDDVAVFKNFASVLEKNGKVIISTPAAGNTHDDDEHSFIDEHFRSGYSPEEITKKLSEANLQVERVGFTYGFAGSIYWMIVMKAPITLLNKSMLFFIVLPLYYLIAFPVALIFMAIDYFFAPKGGGGLLVVAQKQ